MTKETLPKHIAIIMDGNGRWAKEKGLKRTAGHQEGANVVRQITKYCNEIGIEYLTLYAFSTENWNRPKLEVEFLMRLLETWIENELEVFINNNVRFKTIGDLSKFSNRLQKTIKNAIHKTKNCTGLTQVLALNYGSRDEITRAVQKVVDKNLPLTQENIQTNLDTAGYPDVDMLIRTSGEVRISNYQIGRASCRERV